MCVWVFHKAVWKEKGSTAFPESEKLFPSKIWQFANETSSYPQLLAQTLNTREQTTMKNLRY